MGKILAVMSAVFLMGQAPLSAEIAYDVSGLFALGGSSTVIQKAPLMAEPELSISPNPFTLSVAIRVNLPGNVSIRIFDASGRLIRSAVSAKNAFAWDGKDGSGKPVVSGLYFVKAASGTRSVTGRMLLMR